MSELVPINGVVSKDDRKELLKIVLDRSVSALEILSEKATKFKYAGEEVGSEIIYNFSYEKENEKKEVEDVFLFGFKYDHEDSANFQLSSLFGANRISVDLENFDEIRELLLEKGDSEQFKNYKDLAKKAKNLKKLDRVKAALKVDFINILRNEHSQYKLAEQKKQYGY